MSRRARTLAAGLLLLGLAACMGESDQSGAPTPTGSVSMGPAPPSTEEDVAATRKHAEWLLHAVPMPPGAREWKHSPTAHFRDQSLGIGPSDAAFHQVTWWTTPVTSGAFETWLREHAPRSLRGSVEDSSAATSRGVFEHDITFHSASTLAHTRGYVNLAFTSYGGGVAVRVDTFVGARFGRTAFVPTDARAVTVERRTQPAGSRTSRGVALVVDKAAEVARLIALVNRQPGAMTVPFIHGCPRMLVDTTYTLTFATPDGEWVATHEAQGCDPELMLTHDGTQAGPALEPQPGFTKALDRLLRNASAPASPHS